MVAQAAAAVAAAKNGKGMMKRLSAALAVTTCMIVAGFGAEAADFSIRASHAESTESPLHKGWLVFEAFVEGASGGQIDVTVLPSGQLGSIHDTLEQARLGAIEIAQGDEANLDPFFKPMLFLATPYLFEDDEEGIEFLRRPFFTDLKAQMAEESGLRFLSAASYGFRCFTNNVKPIKTAADLAGVRMRVPPSPMSLAMVEAMGGSPTPVPWEELYGAMQQGVVDGQENPIGIIHDYSFYQVQKYLTVDNRQLGFNTMMMNEAFFQSLPPELRKVVETGAQMAAATEYGERNYQARVNAVGSLREQGMEVYFPTPEERATFRDATIEPIRAYLTKELGQEFVDQLYAEIEDLRQERIARVE
jgi:TRAP-type transport system periplasmic protein